MLVFWIESARFNVTSQARMVLKKGWFSVIEILEIGGHVSCEEYEQEPPTRIQTQNTENQNTTDSKTTKPMSTQEDRINL